MLRVAKLYDKYRGFMENLLFPALLLLYPLMGITQGVDVADTTYSLSNFQYFGSMDGTWMVATFLANAAGSLFMMFPFGNTLMGMYFYTSLVQSALALAVYVFLWKKISVPAPFVFVGELIALGLCWCPSTILYNYLTYLLMTSGILALCIGVLQDRYGFYIGAGICLGANVAVRMPNVVQAAFIVVVWYGAAVCGRTFRQAFRDTLWCMLGYAVGFGIPFAAICVRYGAGAYPAMVQTLFAMTEKASDYKPSSMITGMLGDYVTGMYWLAFAGICMAGGFVLFALRHRWFAKSRTIAVLCRAGYGAVLLVLLRFYWGRGMFNFLYYKYGSMYYPAVLLLMAVAFMALHCLFWKKAAREQKILALAVLVQIFVTPLGSNNLLYPIINNLFIAVPFLLWTVAERYAGDGNGICGKRGISSFVNGDGLEEAREAVFVDAEEKGKKEKREEAIKCVENTERGKVQFLEACDRRWLWGAPFLLLVVFVLIQSVGFHLSFSFQDGINGEPRDTRLAAPAKAAGVRTNADNAAWLAELAEYTEKEELAGREVILYGEVPGLGYLLDMPSALSTFWADLDSYRMVEYERDMAQIKTPPVVIVSSPIAAYLNEDADGMNWFGVKKAELDADKKLQILSDYMTAHSYQERFSNGRYVLYMTN